MIDSNTVMVYSWSMNRKSQQALLSLTCCISLPGWVAIAIHRSQDLSRPRPRWEARIRRQPIPVPPERPRLPRRF